MTETVIMGRGDAYVLERIIRLDSSDGHAAFYALLPTTSLNDAEHTPYVVTYRQAPASSTGLISPPNTRGNYSARVPYWLVAISATFIMAFSLILLRKLRRQWDCRNLGLCSHCGYDLRATKERCPECGTPTSPATAEGPLAVASNAPRLIPRYGGKAVGIRYCSIAVRGMLLIASIATVLVWARSYWPMDVVFLTRNPGEDSSGLIMVESVDGRMGVFVHFSGGELKHSSHATYSLEYRTSRDRPMWSGLQSMRDWWGVKIGEIGSTSYEIVMPFGLLLGAFLAPYLLLNWRSRQGSVKNVQRNGR